MSEAMSTLRLRFGEPVRFRFLVGMMMSTGGQKELLCSGLRFLNKFMDTAASIQKRLYIQAELDQAGLDLGIIKKVVNQFKRVAVMRLIGYLQNVGGEAGCEYLHEEIQYWEKKSINVDNLKFMLDNFKKENSVLREKVGCLERKIKVNDFAIYKVVDNRGKFLKMLLVFSCTTVQDEHF